MHTKISTLRESMLCTTSVFESSKTANTKTEKQVFQRVMGEIKNTRAVPNENLCASSKRKLEEDDAGESGESPRLCFQTRFCFQTRHRNRLNVLIPGILKVGDRLKIDPADRTPRETLEERLETTPGTARCFAQGSSLMC